MTRGMEAERGESRLRNARRPPVPYGRFVPRLVLAPSRTRLVTPYGAQWIGYVYLLVRPNQRIRELTTGGKEMNRDEDRTEVMLGSVVLALAMAAVVVTIICAARYWV
jgi:hypothetical protein